MKVATRRGPKSDPDFRMAFGFRVACLRQELGISQRTLAERVGFSRNAVVMIESGAASVNAANIVKFCEALACTPNDLLGWEEE